MRFVLGLCLLLPASAYAELEQSEVTLGFIKLTDMAPLAVAKEYGFFEDEGLQVLLVPELDWQTLLDNVLSGAIDGAQMLPGQALSTVLDDDPDTHIVTPMSLDLNGNAITVSNEVWKAMKANVEIGEGDKPVHPIGAQALKPIVDARATEDRRFTMGMVSPLSTHNYELRYWLAAGGIHPGFYGDADEKGRIASDMDLLVIPPPQMPAMTEAGKIDGYCVGEPWNQQAVADRIGVPVISDHDIWNYNPEKVFGLTRQFVDENPETTQALIRALLRATYWLDKDDGINRGAVVALMSRPDYVGASAAVIGASMTGTFEYESGDVREEFDFNVFYNNNANYPFYSDAVWTLTQMRRWGQIAEHRDDAWYEETARSVYRPDLFIEAAQQLVNTGVVSGADFPWTSDGYREPSDAFIDGVAFDGRKPNEYLESLDIGLKQSSPAP